MGLLKPYRADIDAAEILTSPSVNTHQFCTLRLAVTSIDLDDRHVFKLFRNYASGQFEGCDRVLNFPKSGNT